MKKILIGLDKLNSPNSGFGRVSVDYAQALEDTQDFSFTYLVPSHYDASLLPGKKTIKLTWWRQLFPFYQKRFDLIHSVHQRPEYRIRKDSKLLLTIHDLSFAYNHTKKEQRQLRKKLCRLVHQSTAVAFISDYTLKDSQEKLQIPDSILYRRIYDGVEPLFKKEDRPVDLPDKKVLFSIGVFTKRKNFAVLLPFIKQLPEDYILVISGNENTGYGNYIQFMIEEKGLEDRVYLTGEITEEEKSFLFHHCEAFVFPSIVEGFGLPILEVMQAGKPVFTTDKTSLKEIAGGHAYFWTDFCPASMKKVFEEGMADFNEEKAKAEQEYAATFTWQENVKQYLAYYKEILNM